MSALVRNPSPGNLEFGEPGDPLVVVIPDWFGRLPWLASYAEALARRGLRVVVLDLYDGVATTDEGQAERLASGLERSADEAFHGFATAFAKAVPTKSESPREEGHDNLWG